MWGTLKKLGKRLRRPTYAEVVATLALFIALGGASYAAIQIPKNSVGPKQLKKNAVNSQKVKNRSLLAVDFKPGQLPRGATGPQGSPGQPGKTGPPGQPTQGPAGPPGVPGLVGATGPTGVPGIPGQLGPIGPTGARGATGNVGPTGTTGTAGSIGPTGPTGAGGFSVMSGRSSVAATTQYFMISGISTATASEYPAHTLSPAVPVRARNLSVGIDAAPGVGNVRQFLLRVNGINVFGCTISGPNFSCTNTVDNVLINANSELAMVSAVGGTPVATAVRFGFILGP